MVANEKWFGASAGFYPHTIDQSIRFDGSSSKFEKTPSSDGNRKKWTTSWWVKRAKLGTLQYMWSGASYYGNDGIAALYFNSDDKIHMYFDGNTAPYGAINSRVYRDVSQWYHIVWAVDAENTQTKVWVNGVEETSGIQPPNFSYGMNKASTKMGFGVATWGGSPNYAGYCAEFVHLDGQYLDETYFGEFKNGVWVPKNIEEQNFTFGTNGFYLPFSDSSNIGYDYQTSDRSGTTNDYTTTGLAFSDVVPDSPTNNFSTFNSLYVDFDSTPTYSEGNLRMDATSSSWFNSVSTFSVSSGKWYAEFVPNSSTAMFVNIMQAEDVPTVYPSAQSFGYAYYYNGQKWNNGSGSSYGDSYTDGDVIGVALDMDNGNVYFYKNGVVQNSGTPAFTGLSGDFVIGVSTSGSSGEFRANFGQDARFQGDKTSGSDNASDSNGQGTFYETPPTGYLALCSANLPEPSLSANANEQPDDHFNTFLYTGTNATNRNVALNTFTPDWVWLKARSTTDNNVIIDSSRESGGTYPNLHTNTSDAEASDTHPKIITNGVQVSQGLYDNNGVTFAVWNWKVGGSTPTKTYKVVVVSDSGNKYRFRNSADSATFAQSAVTLDLQEGGTYVFDWSDSTAQGHPIRFSTTSDGTHGGGSEYTTGVVKDDSAYKTTITVASSAPTLYYYCANHSGMGGQVNTNTSHGSTNFDGSTLAVVQSNSTSGVSIVTYTGNGSTATIGHELNAVPKMMVVKLRNTSGGSWIVYHHLMQGSSPEDSRMFWDSSDARGTSTANFNSTAPTSTVFSVGNTSATNGNSNEYVAYIFTDIEGFSKYGDYSGNSSTNGRFVYTGFKPAFLLGKKNTGVDNWFIYDNARDPDNALGSYSLANTSGAEATDTSLDFLSNGFKWRINSGLRNYTGHTYIYMCFAEQPFKFSNAR